MEIQAAAARAVSGSRRGAVTRGLFAAIQRRQSNTEATKRAARVQLAQSLRESLEIDDGVPIDDESL